MADANQAAEELVQVLQRLNTEMAQNGRVSTETQTAYNDAVIRSKTGITNFTAGTQKAADSLGSLVGSVASYTRAMADGAKGAAAGNAAVDQLAESAKAAGAALALMIPGGPVIKALIAGLTLLIGATAEATKKANEMADSLNKGYRGLAKSGAVASEGMTGVFKGAQKLGLSMQELDGYVNLVNDSSKDLAMFAGSAFEGRRQFEDMGKAMKPFQDSLMNAGMSQMEITEGAMGYLRLQARLGQAQGKTTDQLAEGAKKYLIEQDALTKITGQSRKEMEDQRARALQQQQFAAKVRELQLQGREKEAEQLMQLNSIYARFGPKTQAAFQASVTGNLANADALGANIQSQGEMMRTAQMVASGQMTAAQAAQATGKSMGAFTDTVGVGLAQVNAFNGTMGDFAEGQQARILTEGDLVENLKKAQAEQEKQGATGKKAADDVTESYNKMIQAQQAATLKAQEEISKLVPTAIKINTDLANTTGQVVSTFGNLMQSTMKVLEKFGELVAMLADKLLPILDKFVGGLAKVVTAKDMKEAVKESGKAGMAETIGGVATGVAGAKAGAAGGALIGTAIFPGVGTAVGSALGAAVGGVAGYFTGSYLGKKADEDVANAPEPRAAGGPVTSKKPYLVGERGPELFRPDFNGEIINNAELGKLSKIFSTFSSDMGQDLARVNRSADKFSKEYLEYVQSSIDINNQSLKEFQRFDKATENDAVRADKFSLAYKEYNDLRLKIIDQEKPLLNQALAQLTNAEPTPSVGPAPAVGPTAGGIGGMIKNIMGGLLGGGTGLKPGGGTGLKASSRQDLESMGLRLKKGDVQADDSKVSPKLLAMAQQIQSSLPDFAYFSGFNDKFHQEKSPSSKHTQGLAADFTLTQPPSPERGQEIVNMLKGLGASTVIDEYNQPSSKATAGHIHVAVPEFEYGGIVTGPDSGYNARLHGSEAVIPLNNGAGNFARVFEEMNAGIKYMSGQMDEMIRAQKNSVDLQGKILKANY